MRCDGEVRRAHNSPQEMLTSDTTGQSASDNSHVFTVALLFSVCLYMYMYCAHACSKQTTCQARGSVSLRGRERSITNSLLH